LVGDDLEGLLFHFLDEWLFVFSADDFFIPRKIIITEFDAENFKIKSTGYGEQFDLAKHPQASLELDFDLNTVLKAYSKYR
jgi:SHS2 domain-containing protein